MEMYEKLEDWEYKWYFKNKELFIPTHDLQYLKPLTREYSSILWENLVSKKKRHGMLFEKKEFMKNMKFLYNWEEDWNNNNIEPFSIILKEHMDISDESIIYFFWMKERGMETKWIIFLKYWICFLYEDEAPIHLNNTNNKVVLFGPRGFSCIGDSVK